jgi:hypothetical protein
MNLETEAPLKNKRRIGIVFGLFLCLRGEQELFNLLAERVMILKRRIGVILFAFLIGLNVCPADSYAFNQDLYENDKAKKTRGVNANDLQDTAIKALKFIGGWGGIVFTMAFMILAMMLGSGGINPYKRSKVYVGLVTVAIAAFLFFSAWQFAPAIANLALTK